MYNNKVNGVIEEALIGTPMSNPKMPIEALRVVHSFAPCLGVRLSRHDDGRKTDGHPGWAEEVRLANGKHSYNGPGQSAPGRRGGGRSCRPSSLFRTIMSDAEARQEKEDHM